MEHTNKPNFLRKTKTRPFIQYLNPVLAILKPNCTNINAEKQMKNTMKSSKGKEKYPSLAINALKIKNSHYLQLHKVLLPQYVSYLTFHHAS
jgi:hypothetical protein